MEMNVKNSTEGTMPTHNTLERSPFLKAIIPSVRPIKELMNAKKMIREPIIK
jgi:hypothetical protein